MLRISCSWLQEGLGRRCWEIPMCCDTNLRCHVSNVVGNIIPTLTSLARHHTSTTTQMSRFLRIVKYNIPVSLWHTISLLWPNKVSSLPENPVNCPVENYLILSPGRWSCPSDQDGDPDMKCLWLPLQLSYCSRLVIHHTRPRPGPELNRKCHLSLSVLERGGWWYLIIRIWCIFVWRRPVMW